MNSSQISYVGERDSSLQMTREANTKEITQTNQKVSDEHDEPIRFPSNQKARETSPIHGAIGFGFAYLFKN